MDAEIVSLAGWKAAHPVRRRAVLVVFDPWWAVRLWLRCWGMK